MLKHSVSCVELGCHIGEGGGRKSDVRKDFHLSSREKRFIKGPTRDNSCHSENCADHTRWSIGSSFSRELPQNLSTVSSVVSSDIDRWLSSEVLAPLASREDSKLTEEIRRSRSFCFGEFQNSSFESESRPVSCEFVIGQDTREEDSLNSEESESRPVSCEFSFGQDTREEDSLNSEGLLGVSKEGVTEFSDNKSTIEQDSEEFSEEVFNSEREQREHKNQPAPREETQIDEISQSFESQIQENSQVDLQDKLSDLIDKNEPAAKLEPDEKQKSNTIEPDEKHEPENQEADKEIEPEIKEADKTQDPDRLKQDENHEPSKLEELDPDQLESKKTLEPEKSGSLKNQEQSKEKFEIEKPESYEELEPNIFEPEKKQNVNKSNSVDNQELGKTEPNKLEQGKQEPGDNQKLHTSVSEEKLNQEQNSEEADNLIPKERQEFKKLEADGTQYHYQIELYKLEPEEKQERDNLQKLDKLEPEQIQGSCNLEPDEKEEQKEKQKHRNVHSDELEQNGKQDSEKLEVVRYKQERKQEPNKLKPGEDQETNFPHSNKNVQHYTKESIYPEKLDSRNCTQNSESLEYLLFQHQAKREASNGDGVSVNTETEGEEIALNSEQSTNTCTADKNLKDNDSLEKEKESVFCKDKRKENSKDKLEEDNVFIDKRVEKSNSIDIKEEESFSKDKVVKDVFGIDKGEEENKKIYREENENAKVDTEKEILDNIDEWEEKVSIHKVEEEDESDKDNESLEKLEETEIPDSVCPRHEIDLNCDPNYLEEGSTKCSFRNEELTSTLNEEKECLPPIRPIYSQTDQSNQGTQNIDLGSFPSDFFHVNQRSQQEFSLPSEKQIDSATVLKGSESKQTFGVSAQDHRPKIVPMKEEEEQICSSN
ncbi:glutamic acid-rich protein-like [Magallana gigas]|uniref:glutamic acid-rich protein-like n=1 Tax=Magallana gigas TaxID=29159 RepID=UPI00333E47F3